VADVSRRGILCVDEQAWKNIRTENVHFGQLLTQRSLTCVNTKHRTVLSVFGTAQLGRVRPEIFPGPVGPPLGGQFRSRGSAKTSSLVMTAWLRRVCR